MGDVGSCFQLFLLWGWFCWWKINFCRSKWCYCDSQHSIILKMCNSVYMCSLLPPPVVLYAAGTACARRVCDNGSSIHPCQTICLFCWEVNNRSPVARCSCSPVMDYSRKRLLEQRLGWGVRWKRGRGTNGSFQHWRSGHDWAERLTFLQFRAHTRVDQHLSAQ